jgi:hypothetical protein
MSQWIGKVTISSTGTKRFTLGSFLPTWARIYIDEDNSGTDPNTHICIGETDGTNQSYESFCKNSTNELYESGADRIIKHNAYSGGFVTHVEAEFLAFEVFAGLNVIKLNVITPSSNYKAKIVCGD